MTTVIIPAYNAAPYLEATIASLLAQTDPDWEALILDDASTDHTLALATRLAQQDSRIHVHQNPRNLGVAETRNRGMELAQGNWIAFLDADDLWLPDKLEVQLALLQATSADLCYTGYSFIDEQGNAIRKPYRVPERVDQKGLLRENVIGLSTVVMRKDAADCKAMRKDFLHEDYVFWLELLGDGRRAVGIERPLMQYRVSRSNRSGDKKSAARERWRIYREFLHLSPLRSAGYFFSYALRGAFKHLL